MYIAHHGDSVNFMTKISERLAGEENSHGSIHSTSLLFPKYTKSTDDNNKNI